MTKHPILSDQRAKCMSARGNLTQEQAGKAAGVTKTCWHSWEVERVGAPPGVIHHFRRVAFAMFPHYRSDLRMV